MTEVETIIEMNWILSNCEEIGDCLIWQRSVNADGNPQYRPMYADMSKLVRRTMFRLNGGTIGHRVPLGSHCGDKRCVHPDHHYKSSMQAAARKAAKKGAFSGPAKCAKIAAMKRRTEAKLTMEIAREIRMSEESGPVLGARYGVDASLIRGIKNGTRWKEYSGSNPFAGLMQ